MISETKAGIFWILGAASMFAGVRIVSAADRSILGATNLRFYSALLTALGLLLVGGLLWISVGGALGKEP